MIVDRKTKTEDQWRLMTINQPPKFTPQWYRTQRPRQDHGKSSAIKLEWFTITTQRRDTVARHDNQATDRVREQCYFPPDPMQKQAIA